MMPDTTALKSILYFLLGFALGSCAMLGVWIYRCM